MIVRIFKNIGNWYSYYRINRSWYRYWNRIRSAYFRCIQKPFFKTSALYIFYFGLCFVGSYRFVCNNDGFFAIVCGIGFTTNHIGLLLLALCLTIVVYYLAKKWPCALVKESMPHMVKNIFTKIPPFMLQRLFALVSVTLLFSFLVLLICLFSIYILPELELSAKCKIGIHYIFSLLSLVMSIFLSGNIYYKNWYKTPILNNNKNRNNKTMFLIIITTVIVIATLRGLVVLKIYQHSNDIVELTTLESNMSYFQDILLIEILLSSLIFSGIKFMENKLNAIIYF